MSLRHGTLASVQGAKIGFSASKRKSSDSGNIKLTDLLLGREYCVMARHFRQPGIVSTCNLFAMANVSNCKKCVPVHLLKVLTSIDLADPCGIIETQYGLSHARFVAWNPALGTNCELFP